MIIYKTKHKLYYTSERWRSLEVFRSMQQDGSREHYNKATYFWNNASCILVVPILEHDNPLWLASLEYVVKNSFLTKSYAFLYSAYGWTKNKPT